MLDESRIALIRRWSMEGARAALVVERADEPRRDPLPDPTAVLVRPAGGDDWRPLRAEPTPA